MYQLTHITARPLPRKVNSIGVWNPLLDLAVEMSSLVNAGLMFLSYAILSYLHGDYYHLPLQDYWKDAFLFGLLFERGMRALQVLIGWVWPAGGTHSVDENIVSARGKYKRRHIHALEEEQEEAQEHKRQEEAAKEADEAEEAEQEEQESSEGGE
jgi:hypothetical protein